MLAIHVQLCQRQDMACKGHDYDAARILHSKGLTIKQISDETGIPYEPLAKYAQRKGWTLERTKVVQSLSMRVQEQLIERSTGHLLKMSGFADRAIDTLIAKGLDTLKLTDLQVLANVADTFDKIARRTYGLDAKQAEQTHLHLGVVVQGEHASSMSMLHTVRPVIDVQAEPVTKPANQISEAANNEASNQSAKPAN